MVIDFYSLKKLITTNRQTQKKKISLIRLRLRQDTFKKQNEIIIIKKNKFFYFRSNLYENFLV